MPLSEEEQIAAAGAVVDVWNQGWNDADPDVVVSVFTDDGVHITGDGETQTMDVVRVDVLNRGRYVTNIVRVGECTPVSDDTFACASEFDGHGYRYAVAQEVELEGDLAVRLEHLDVPDEIGLASDAPGALDVTIESTLDSLGASPDPIGTFLAMGPAVDEGIMCPSGTLEERGRNSDDGITGRLEVTFVCADGSGEFLVWYGPIAHCAAHDRDQPVARLPGRSLGAPFHHRGG